MSYDYATERPELFTERGTKALLKLKDRIAYLLKEAGAFRHAEAMKDADFGSSWQEIAALDYLVEIGEIEVANDKGWAQYRVFVKRWSR